MTTKLTLLQLEAKFIKRDDSRRRHIVDSINVADGIQFLCPVCFLKNNGPIGTHSVICWSPTVPQDTSPTPGWWSMLGTSLENLTLVASSSSVKLESKCNAHFFVRNGAIEVA